MAMAVHKVLSFDVIDSSVQVEVCVASLYQHYTSNPRRARDLVATHTKETGHQLYPLV